MAGRRAGRGFLLKPSRPFYRRTAGLAASPKGFAPIGVGTSSATVWRTTAQGVAPIGVATSSGTSSAVSLVAGTTGTAGVNVGSSSTAMQPLTFSMTADSDFVLSLVPFDPFIFSMTADSYFDLHFVQPVLVDPITGKTQYRLVVSKRDGTRLAELTQATIASPSVVLNAMGGVDFTLPNDSPQIAYCLPVLREVQVWRGTRLIETYVILKATGDGKVTTFQCGTLDWYFTKRRVGKVPTPNLMLNGSFADGERFWSFRWAHGPRSGTTSVPPRPPVHSIVSGSLTGHKALQLTGAKGAVSDSLVLPGDTSFTTTTSTTLSTGGQAAIDAMCAAISDPAPRLTCEGHTDNVGSALANYTLSLARANSVKTRILGQISGAVVTVVGYGETRPVATNDTSLGRAANRRVEVGYSFVRGHRQYAVQSFRFTNPSASKKPKTLTLVGWCYLSSFLGQSRDGWGLYLQRQTPAAKVVGSSFTVLDKDTPRRTWTRFECSLDVPADDVEYFITMRLYPPYGTCVWDETSLTGSDELSFIDVDGAHIVKALVEHAQDPAMGKSDLNIGTRCGTTGVKWSRDYPFWDRKPVGEAIMEFATLENGMDIKVVTTPTSRKLTTYFPRKGRDAGVVLSLSDNIMNFTVDVDGTGVATTVIVQASGQDSSREEGVVQNATLTEGLVLEEIYPASTLAPVSTLHAQAVRGWKRYHSPITVTSLTMMPTATDNLLNRVAEGDVVKVVISKGWVQVNAKYRITSYTLDPASDQLTYGMVPA